MVLHNYSCSNIHGQEGVVMNLSRQRKVILDLLLTGEPVPLYKIPSSIRNHTARISELRGMGYDIPAPVLKKNREGNMMSTYQMGGG